MSGTDDPPVDAPGFPPPGSDAPGPVPAYPPPGSSHPPPGPGLPPSPGAAPPGWAPAATGQPGWGTPSPPPGTWGAAHKPGAVPLRPLSLGDIYDAAFKVVRVNPAATVGSAVLVAAAGMLLPVLVTAALTLFSDVTLLDPSGFDTTGSGSGTASPGEELAAAAPTLLLVVGSMVSAFGQIFVTGMVTHVTAAAAVGRRLTLGQAWGATRGRRWRLVGLSLLLTSMWVAVFAAYVGIVVAVAFSSQSAGAVIGTFLLVGLLFVPLCLFLWVRVSYLAVPPLMLERVGVFRAVARGFTLTRGQFWRTFGIALLTAVLVGIAGNVLTIPLGMVGIAAAAAVADPQTGVLVVVASQALGTVLATALTAPFSSGVTSLQYLDQRIRKEAYDMELLAQAGVLGR